MSQSRSRSRCQPARGGSGRCWGRRLERRNYTLLLVLAVVWLTFPAGDGRDLPEPAQSGVAGAAVVDRQFLAAISAVMLIVTRNFDLSVGSAVALVGTVLAILTVREGWQSAAGLRGGAGGGAGDGGLAGAVGDAVGGVLLHRHPGGVALLPRGLDDPGRRGDDRAVAGESDGVRDRVRGAGAVDGADRGRVWRFSCFFKSGRRGGRERSGWSSGRCRSVLRAAAPAVLVVARRCGWRVTRGFRIWCWWWRCSRSRRTS